MLLKAARIAVRAIVAKLVGLKPSRVDQWLEVLDEESNVMTWRTWKNMLIAGIRVSVSHPVGSSDFKHRIRICQACPIYDPELRRCRPYTGSSDGCGCYVPFKALDDHHCWIHHQDSRRGW